MGADDGLEVRGDAGHHPDGVLLRRERRVGLEGLAPDVEVRAVGRAQEEAGQDVAAAEAGEKGRRAQERRRTLEERDEDPVLGIGAVDEQSDGPAAVHRGAHLERRRHGGADVDRLDAQARAQLQPHLLDGRVELRLADDGRRQAVRLQRHRSHLPVADVAGHEQESAPAAAAPREHAGVLARAS